MKTSSVNVRVDGDIRAWINSEAKRRRVPNSIIVREILLRAYATERKGGKPQARTIQGADA